MKRVYSFGNGVAEGAGLGKETLGGKGAGLAEMTALGIPVPPGFTIETSVCADVSRGASLDGDPRPRWNRRSRRLEHDADKHFGDPENPLLVSVRSGARSSMPGMMDTILNLGLTSRTVKALAARSGDRFAFDCRRRFIEMYGDVVLRVPRHEFEKAMQEVKKARGVSSDTDLTAADLAEIVRRDEQIVRQRTGHDFPDDPREQLWGAISAVFRSWDNERAKTYRKLHHIPDDWGTAVNVQAMVFGNRGDTSATGVAFTRDPATGERKFYGEFLPNAQGEDVVAGIRTPRPLNSNGSGLSLEETMPKAYAELQLVRERLEKRFRDMQDLEFTIEEEQALPAADPQREADGIRGRAHRDRHGRRGPHRRGGGGRARRARADRAAARAGLRHEGEDGGRQGRAAARQGAPGRSGRGVRAHRADGRRRRRHGGQGGAGGARARGDFARGHRRDACRGGHPHDPRRSHLPRRGRGARDGQDLHRRRGRDHGGPRAQGDPGKRGA